MTNSANPSEGATTNDVSAASTSPVLHRAAMALMFLAITAGLLAPIWTVQFPLLIDYPNHLASAFVLAHLRDAAYQYGQYYRADWNTYPYLAMDVILLGLQQVVSIDLAGRLFISLCVLSVPAAAWFFIRRANPGEERLVFWSLLVTNNLYFFRYGFLNLQLSMAICFFLLGLWLWHLERPRAGTWCLLLLVTMVLYFTHLVGFAVAAVVMTAYGLSVRRPIKEMALAWALYIPGMLCYLHAVAGHGARGEVQFRPLLVKAGSLVSLMVECSTPVDVITMIVMLGVLAWAQIDNPEFKWNRHWRRATWILFLFYWILPAAIGPATNVDKRLLPFVFVLSLAGAKAGSRGRKLAIIALLLFFVRTGVLEKYFVSEQPRFASMAGANAAIPPGARVLPLVDWAGGATLPERHFWAYGVINRGWVSPCLFHDPGVHPFALKHDTYDPCAQAFTSTSKLDWGRVASDFDYVWAYRVPQFSSSLSSIGVSTFRNGDLEVFRLNRAVTPAPAPH